MMASHNNPILWYFADPMCSWCWGFSPVISEIKKNYEQQIKIALVMGGLQAGETNILSDSSREEIFHHWHQVNETTGQQFSFEDALKEGFIYNTEPACRAVITAGLLDATKTFTYFTSVQAAFYTKNQDVTDLYYLKQLATDCGLDAEEFEHLFLDDKQSASAKKSFEFTQKVGVQGFPTLILNIQNQLHVITRGYQDYQGISTSLDKFLFA